jgi:hypothetical protein
VTEIVLRSQLSRADIVKIVRQECEETIQASQQLDDASARRVAEMTVRVLWLAVRSRLSKEGA